MYKIIKSDGTELGVTDSVLFIKVSPEGTYIEATEDEAAGVAFEGTAYNLPGHSEIVDADTVILAPITLGEYIKEQNEKWERMQAGVDYLAMMSGVDFDAEQSERKEEVAEKVREYFEKGLWAKTWVKNAVVKGWITAEEYETITGETYE